MKKFVRSYMIMLGCFPGKKCTVIFASPKVDAAKQDLIMPALEELQADARFKDKEITLEYIANDKFKEEILDQNYRGKQGRCGYKRIVLEVIQAIQYALHCAKACKKKEYVADLDPLEEVEDYLEDEEV